MAVAEGTGVSLGRGDAVGCNCANAVWNAWVNAAFISGVGAVAGWQALHRIGSKIVMRKRRVNFRMEAILSEKTKTSLLVALLGFIRFPALINDSTFSREKWSRSCSGEVLKKSEYVTTIGPRSLYLMPCPQELRNMFITKRIFF
jgi:hypothetical protein